jgi:hypothetical protein
MRFLGKLLPLKNPLSTRLLLLLALMNGLAYGLLAAERKPEPPTVQDADIPVAEMDFSLQVFPNPNAGRFRVDVEGTFADTAQLVIINVEGKRVYQLPIAQGGAFAFNLSSLRKGIYFAQIRTAHQVVSCPILYAYDPQSSTLPGAAKPKP